MNPKDVLTKGAVKPWHVIFIVLVAYVVGGVAAEKIVRSFDDALAGTARIPLSISIAAAIILAFTLVVPEFRRAIPILFRSPRTPVSTSDAACALATTVCWGFGLYLAGVCLPLLRLRPDWFGALGFLETVPVFKTEYLLIVAGYVIAAPLAEELVFRGFLLNLWIARWGVGLAVAGSSVFFGLMHMERALFAVPLGAILALVYLKYDSLWPAIALHAFYNSLTFYWVMGSLVGIKDRATVQDPSNWIPEITLAILFFPAAWFFWKRFEPRS